MRLIYDPKANTAYMHLKNKVGKVRTIAVSDELNIDLAPDGSIYGIEFLNANAQLRSPNSKVITLINNASGKRCKLPIAG